MHLKQVHFKGAEDQAVQIKEAVRAAKPGTTLSEKSPFSDVKGLEELMAHFDRFSQGLSGIAYCYYYRFMLLIHIYLFCFSACTFFTWTEHGHCEAFLSNQKCCLLLLGFFH